MIEPKEKTIYVCKLSDDSFDDKGEWEVLGYIGGERYARSGKFIVLEAMKDSLRNTFWLIGTFGVEKAEKYLEASGIDYSSWTEETKAIRKEVHDAITSDIKREDYPVVEVPREDVQEFINMKKVQWPNKETKRINKVSGFLGKPCERCNRGYLLLCHKYEGKYLPTCLKNHTHECPDCGRKVEVLIYWNE